MEHGDKGWQCETCKGWREWGSLFHNSRCCISSTSMQRMHKPKQCLIAAKYDTMTMTPTKSVSSPTRDITSDSSDVRCYTGYELSKCQCGPT